MRRRLLLLLVAGAAFVAALVLGGCGGGGRGRVVLVTQGGRRVRLCVDEARTLRERERGLMGRRSLRPYDGMLFTFPGTVQEDFWMYQTLIPLELVPVLPGGAAERPIEMQPCPPALGRSCPVYHVPQPYVATVELAPQRLESAGFVWDGRAAPQVAITEERCP